MSFSNQTRHTKWHKTCKCKCIIDASVCSYKQISNEDKCRCECKGLIGKEMCDEGFIWNPSYYECKWDKSCDIGEYSDYENCKFRNKLADKLDEQYIENIDGNNILYNETLDVIS